jgi:hypothetical protein
VDFSDRSRAPRRLTRIPKELEDTILAIRKHLRESSDLGEYGDEAIRRELSRLGTLSLPCSRTIARVLQRRGALDRRHRLRRPPPPPGWYLPEVACGQKELDSFDFIEDLSLEGGPHFDVLTGISLRGGWPDAWPLLDATAQPTLRCLLERWKAVGLPCFAQFDNDLRFLGPRQHQDAIGRIVRACLSLGVVPVFAPPREHGFQNDIEALNGRWKAKVWNRFHFSLFDRVLDQSERYIKACRVRHAARIESAPLRRKFPSKWTLDLDKAPSGRLIFLRRTNATGVLEVLGHRIQVDPLWSLRLVRSEVDLQAGMIRLFGLRRRDPVDQPLLHQTEYQMPARRFTP